MNSAMTRVGVLSLAVFGSTAAAQPCVPGWSPVGSYEFQWPGVYCLTVFDDGGGPALFVGGQFIQAWGLPGSRGLLKWDGQAWSSVGGGMERSVWATTIYHDASGPVLVAGGNFSAAGGVPANRIAKWNGTSWSALGEGIGQGRVYALAEFNGDLYAGGDFTTAGGTPARNIARWDGAAWSELLGGSHIVGAMMVHDFGDGPRLYVGTDAYIFSCDGASSFNIGAGLSTRTYGVYAMAVYNGELIAGGDFRADGYGAVGNFIAKWDGQYWSPLGTGLDNAPFAMAVFDDGSGPALFVGGVFTTAGDLPAAGIAKWDGASWSAVGGGITSADSGGYRQVLAISPFQGGGGNLLYVGGQFGSLGNIAGTMQLGRWQGCPHPCCPSDYNGDGDVGTDADIEAFFSCLSGNCCFTCPSDADFNCDGDVGTDADIESFFRVLAGGSC